MPCVVAFCGPCYPCRYLGLADRGAKLAKQTSYSVQVVNGTGQPLGLEVPVVKHARASKTLETDARKYQGNSTFTEVEALKTPRARIVS